MAIYYQHPMNVCRASAGTGKTFTLAAYYVGLLLSGESYRNILAVTFTNKATAEMKERILGYLYGIATGTGDEAFLKKALELSGKGSVVSGQWSVVSGQWSVRARAEQCFREMLLDYDNVQVSTIDSFLQTLLAGMAKMLGKAAGFRVELNLKQVITKAVDRLLTTDMSPTLQQIMGDYLQEQLRQEGRWDIRQTLINLALDLYNEQVQMLVSDGKVELDEKTISGYKRSLDRWAQLPAMQNLQNMVAQARTANEALAKPDKDVGKAITRIERSLAGDRTLPSKDCFRWLTEKKLEKTTDPLLLNINEQASRCGKIYRECMLTCSCLNDMRLMKSLLQEIETCLQDENRMLLAKTADTLRNALKEGDADFVLEKAGIRYKHIMIDEFQDTSTLQWQVFQPLIADVLAGEGHTLLIVGDIKQSIYRWRNGDWHIMAELGTEKDPFQTYFNKDFAPLVKNFRSRRNVVQFNLQTMMRVCDLNEENKKIKGLYDEGYRTPSNSPYEGGDNLSDFYNSKNDGGFVRLRVYPKCRATKKKTATSAGETPASPVSLAEQTLQTERVQQDILTDMFATIRQLLDKGERASDIMILVRINKQAQQVVDFYNAQVEWHNEVRIVSADSFHIDQSQSVQMIINALLATDPAQNIALRYVDLHLPEHHPAKANLQERLAATNDLPLYEQVQALIRLLLCDEEGRFMPDDIAYVHCFMDKLMNYVATEGANRQAFLQYWADMMHTDSISAPDSNAMRIMSIHSSKGLESKTLFIPFCNWAVVDNTKHPNLWCEACVEPQGNVKRLKQVPIPWKQAMEGTGYEAAYQQEAEAQRVDNLNLLYVALTRAADNLYLYTDWLVQTKEGEVDQHVGTLLMNAYVLKEAALEAFENYSDETKPCFAEYLLGEAPYIHRPKQEQKADLFSFRNAEEVQAAMQSNDDQVRFRQSQESMLYGLFGEEKAEQMIAHINIGSFCHDILAHMVTREEQAAVVERYMQRGVIESEAQRCEVESLLNRAWENPQMCEWFDGSWDLLREQAMMVNGEEKRPDRVMLKGDKAIVLDYKFGAPNPKYHKQVADYMEVMRLLGYREVEGYLWYAQQGKLERVNALSDRASR
ncbi:MAG: UvrD-helicase domain-containing protein [Paludibacteraceae bacterium]|nr:UvrD-helicase domain-containing protein [Paludibacteraceae bacterium]